MPAREAALARGFVLGEDDLVDARTVEDFRRSGLSHLLAVSGENVTLLALLAMLVLGAFGIPLRERLLWVLGLIAVYVPLAGAGPSIQRAGVMGAAGVLATLAGRRASRLYALALALGVTLAIDPAVGADVGWQLSFAAVLGILTLASPLREAIVGRIESGGLRRTLAEGIAVTVSATLATAPLIVFHFEALSTTSLPANVLAMPAVAPAMWLGMASAAASQVPGFPLEPLNGLDALLLAYIAEVATWCGRPSWAEVPVHLGVAGLVGAYVTLAVAVAAGFRLGRKRRLAAIRQHAAPPAGEKGGQGSFLLSPRLAASALVLATVALFALASASGDGQASAPSAGLRVEVLDVGQGDAILLKPANAAPVLVDGGPPGDDLIEELEASGVDRLGAVVATHDQADHVGGLEELLGRFPVARLLYARLGREPLVEARAAGATPVRVDEGDEVRAGALRLDVLWPPRELFAAPPPGADPNQLAVVLLVRWRSFSMLLTADAEAEAVPLDPGPVDVLKVAHHGSDDAGLSALLDRTLPRLAVISVGTGNPYGHPTPETLATLAAHGVHTLRTDLEGTISIEVRGHSIEVETGD
jgi:competence protein ComEC